MKKKLISLLCACTTAVCSIPAYAEAAEDPCNVTANGILWCNSVFDDSGLIAGLDTGFSGGIYDGDRYFVSTNLPPERQDEWMQDYDSDEMLNPAKKLTFCINSPLPDTGLFFPKTPEQNDAALAVFEKYFPNSSRNAGIRPEDWDGTISGQQYSIAGDTCYRFSDIRDAGNPKKLNETVNALRKELTDEGLIAAFYAPGTVCIQREIYIPYLTGYSASKNPDTRSYSVKPALFENYIAAHNLNCTLQTAENDYSYTYYVVPDEKLDFAAHYQLALQIRNDLGLLPEASDDSFKSSLPPLGYCPDIPDMQIPTMSIDSAGSYTAEITDPEAICRLLSSYIESKHLDAKCFIAEDYAPYPEYEGKIVVEYERDSNPEDLAVQIKRYAVTQKMDTYQIHPAALVNGSRPEPAEPSDPFKKIPDELYEALDAGAEAVKVRITIVNPSPDAAERSAAPKRIMQEIGIDPETAVVTDEAFIYCMINREQLAKAEQNENIYRIRRCDTWTYSGEIPADPADPEAVRAMFTALFAENNLDAACADSTAYPDYSEPVIVEYNITDGGPAIGQILAEFAAKYGIDREMFAMIPVLQNGEPVQSSFPEAASTIRGDVNCMDGVDVSDAVLTARFAAEDKTVKISAQGKINADMNEDGKITAEDVVEILKIIAKIK